MMKHETSVAVLATPGNRMAMYTTRGTTRAGSSAPAIRVTLSRATSICPASASARLFAIEIVNTRCAARNRERWRRSARFEWSPVVICATTAIVLLICDREGSQAFYAGVKRERELEHDVQVYRAFEREAERLEERGARIDRVVVDYELKRDYQKWLHERDRDRDDYDGHPDREASEIEQWAHDHDLPYFDEQVHFPDARIQYEDADGRWDHVDVEVVTVHYRGAHGAAAARSGFSCYGGSSARAGGNLGIGDLAEEMLR